MNSKVMPENVAILLEKTAAYIEELEARNAQLENELNGLHKTASAQVQQVQNEEDYSNMTLDKIASFGGDVENDDSSEAIGWDNILKGNSLGEPSLEKVSGANPKTKLETFLESMA